MRVLLIAYACRPDMGSEPMAGWSAYRMLRSKHEVRVVCSGSGQPSLSAAIREGVAREKDFVFIPERWKFTGKTALDKLITWGNILSFQRKLRRLGQIQIESFCPDVIHHVTISTWRTGNPLAGRGIPFIWGPVGGGENFPLRFLGGLSAYSFLFELLRLATGVLSRNAPGVRETALGSDWIFASNFATSNLLLKIGSKRDRLEVLPQFAFSEEKLQEFALRPSWNQGNPIRIFSGGYVEARKGIGLALRALDRLKQRGLTFEYEHGGIGPELEHLKKQSLQLGLGPQVRFVAPYSGAAYKEKLRSTDIFLFPSLRDNCPATLLEAMGHGCVPVVADHAGPGEIVTPKCGIKIPLTRPAEFVDRLAEELAGLFQDADRRRRLGEAARLRVIENFSQEHWLQRVEAAYQKVTAGTRRF